MGRWAYPRFDVDGTGRNGEAFVKILMLLGAQGSGKGTQSARLAQECGLVQCASGDLLREAMALGTPLGARARPYYDSGELVPDDLIIGMILERLNSLSGANGIILDGFPRNRAQAEALDAALRQMGQKIEGVIYLDVPRALLVERISGRLICRAQGHVYNINTNPPRVPGICDIDQSELYQRKDDIGDALEHKLDIFFAETLPLTKYYDDQDKLIKVDGTQSIEEVNRQILAKLPGA